MRVLWKICMNTLSLIAIWLVHLIPSRTRERVGAVHTHTRLGIYTKFFIVSFKILIRASKARLIARFLFAFERHCFALTHSPPGAREWQLGKGARRRGRIFCSFHAFISHLEHTRPRHFCAWFMAGRAAAAEFKLKILYICVWEKCHSSLCRLCSKTYFSFFSALVVLALKFISSLSPAREKLYNEGRRALSELLLRWMLGEIEETARVWI